MSANLDSVVPPTTVAESVSTTTMLDPTVNWLSTNSAWVTINRDWLSSLTALLLTFCLAIPLVTRYNIYRSGPKPATVLSVSLSASHDFSKCPTSSITLIEGLGVEGDCHAGVTVQHRSRLHIKPPPANLRQVHLMQNEVLEQFNLKPCDIGENVTTVGIDLLALGQGTKLHFLPNECNEDVKAARAHPVILITGLRNPCPQIEKFRKSLQEKFVIRDAQRTIIGRKAGVMSTIEVGGQIDKGMKIVVEKPSTFIALECV